MADIQDLKLEIEKGLPFNSEGYERAKNILKSNYGKIKRDRAGLH